MMILTPGCRTLLLAGALLAAAADPAQAGASPWREINSDMPADPALKRGTLENGVRFAVMQHAYPANRVSIKLLVASGSRDERNEERGIAHFVEHMAFRGTKSFPKGAVAIELEKLGIGFGPDVSAFTSYDNTIYSLELPDNKPATLEFALRIFREFADGITFEPTAIDLERVVIFNEKSIRNSSDYREVGMNEVFLWPTAREERRSPIGLAETVSKFRREQLVGFYDAWYRPERMAVVIAGDIDPAVAVELLGKQFSSLRGRGELPAEPTGLVPEKAGSEPIQIYKEPGIAGVAIILENPFESDARPDNKSERREQLNLALATTMFQARIRREAQGPNALVASPDISVSGPVKDWGLVSFSGSGRIDNWREMLPSMEKQLRKAMEHGFTAGELKQAKAAFAAGYDEGVRTAETRYSASIAAELAGNLLTGAQFSTPVAVRDEAGPLLDAASIDDCNAAFRDLWAKEPPRVFIAANDAFDAQVPEIQRLLDESRAIAVGPPTEVPEVAFAYDSFGNAGGLDRHQQVADLGIDLGEFANGVRINFKPTTFDRETILLTVRVGYGRQTMPAIGLDFLANAAFLGGGLGKQPWPELCTIIASKNLTLSFVVGDDALIFFARTSRRDLEFCLQAIAAYLVDPAYRVDSLGDARVAISTVYAQIRNAPGGEIGARVERIITGDNRFGVPSADEIGQRDLTQLAGWLTPQLKSGPVEVAFVGDTTWDEVVAATSKTLGALPKRNSRSSVTGSFIKVVAPTAVQTFTTGPMIRQASFSVIFPAGDAYGAEQDRRCEMVASVLEEMFRVSLREDLGATYTPSVSFIRHRAFPGLAYFQVSADVLPGDLEKLSPIITKTISNIQKVGVPQDIFDRVRQTILRQVSDSARSNGYWLDAVVSSLQQNPEEINEARGREKDISQITAQEMQQVAIRYLQLGRSMSLVAVPPSVRLK